MAEVLQVRDLTPAHVGRTVTKIEGREKSTGVLQVVLFARSFRGPHVTLVLDQKGRHKDFPWLKPTDEVRLRERGS